MTSEKEKQINKVIALSKLKRTKKKSAYRYLKKALFNEDEILQSMTIDVISQIVIQQATIDLIDLFQKTSSKKIKIKILTYLSKKNCENTEAFFNTYFNHLELLKEITKLEFNIYYNIYQQNKKKES